MKTSLQFLLPWVLLASAPGVHAAAAVIHHQMTVRLDPARGTLQVTDRMRLPATTPTEFLLHAGLSPRVISPRTARLSSLGPVSGAVPLERFRLEPARGQRQVALSYGGTIRHGFRQLTQSMGRQRQLSAGTIGSDGVFLDGNTGWYPRLRDALLSFSLDVELPAGWLAVSQGAGPATLREDGSTRVRWREDQPQNDLYLIAAPFGLYRRDTPDGQVQVYLRTADQRLAERYLAATQDYLALYSHLIGPYPYAKFALVENFWPTGYGMPSFTLLGSRVIRLPFILYSSYPHEILHNWWGNSVYVDYDQGNWSEGLTTYLADHLLQAQRGRGAAFRRDALRRFADFVRLGNDFPLRAFRARHSGASQAVGYDKGMMLFHMLRRELGDATFIAGLRLFYRNNRFRDASYADLRRAFEQAGGRDLQAFFREWTERTGAPVLAVEDVRVQETPSGWYVTGTLRQTQSAPPYRLRVPLVLYRAGSPPMQTPLETNQRHQTFRLNSERRPLRLDVDPRFDLFRALYPQESPPTLSRLFGADEGLILLPAAADKAWLAGYRQLARDWAAGTPGWRVALDRDIPRLPEDRPVWLLGWENGFLPELRARLAPETAAIGHGGVDLEGRHLPRDGFSSVLVTGHAGTALAWLGAHSLEALPGLARKLPHYGKYSYLAFDGSAPHNRIKGQWPVSASPLRVWLTPARPRLRLPPEAPLAALQSKRTSDQEAVREGGP